MREDAAPPPAGADFGATLEALRARGATPRDAVRLRVIESLARRAADHAGPARRVLDDRLARLVAAHETALGHAEAAVADAPVDDAAPRRGALAALVDRIARAPAAPHRVSPTTTASTGREPAAAPEPVEFFRRTWARLSAEQRLAQSLQTLPENAGPLHSHHLVHRSLTLMRALSPEYFDHFMAHVDGLLWLGRAGDEVAKDAAPIARAGVARKPTRGPG